ncbi:MAG: hypothetical protein ACM3IJ_01585 [Candidatus Levyibacteriota bacterium]
MKVYFDESMSGDGNILLLGMLIVPDGATRLLHQLISKEYKKRKFKKEIKYMNITDRFYLKSAQEILSSFSSLEEAYFRCVCIKNDAKSLRVSDEKQLKSARLGLYIDTAIKLIKANIEQGVKVDIYMDREQKVEKTELRNKLINANFENGAKINSLTFIDSASRANCLLSIPDLLLGGVLQNLFPSTSISKTYKRDFSEFQRLLFGVEDFKEETWVKIPLWKAKKYKKKFHLSYWPVPNFHEFARKKKSRS